MNSRQLKPPSLSRSVSVLLVAGCAFLALTVLDSLTRAEDEADVTADFGAPVPGLDHVEQALFELGRTVFLRRFTRAEGLGPHFNATSCASCHEEPAPGGSSQRYRDFFLAGVRQPDGSVRKLYPGCEDLTPEERKTSPCLPSLVMPHYGPKGSLADPVAAAVEHPAISSDASVVARRNAPPLFGVGLFLLVSDPEIFSRADAFDADGDGISGRVNFISAEDDAVGRFGYKCQTASIEAFNRGALQNQMGITSDSLEFFLGDRSSWNPFEMKTAHAQVAEPRDRITDLDGVPDPEIERKELRALIFFQENLAAPRRGAITRSVLGGEEVFERIGCADCHAPSLTTSLGVIHPYTDLLLHDMGPELDDGVTMEDADGSEFRTQPLWGLCRHAPFLHDGRADTIREAILLHGGEAARARDRYAELPEDELALLHRFLESL